MRRHPGGCVGYITDKLVEYNTVDPVTGKYMLQSLGPYNVGVLFVRFIQLYALNNNDPSQYPVSFNCNLKHDWVGDIERNYVDISMTHQETITVDDLPQEVELHFDADQNDDDIVLKWSRENREDNLYRLSLNEDTGMISAHFRKDGKSIVKSSDGRIEHLIGGESFAGNPQIFIKHRPRQEGPAVITADGGYEYWENGRRIKTA